MPMTLVNSETLASLYYTLAENELSPQESTEILQKFWRLSDSEYPKLNSTLVEEVANLLHQRYAQQREDFLDYFYFDGLGGLSFRYFLEQFIMLFIYGDLLGGLVSICFDLF